MNVIKGWLRSASRLSVKAPLVFVAMLAAAVGLLALTVIWVVQARNAESASLQAAINLRTLTVLTQTSHANLTFAIENGRVQMARAAEMPTFADHAIVDRTVQAVGGVATIFVTDANGAFIRRTTNVKRENGDRAVGTALAPDHPAQALLKAGRPYYGPATLFGRQFFTAYQPVVNPAGAVVGVLFVGTPMEFYAASMASLIWTLVWLALAVVGVTGLLTWFASRSVVQPLVTTTRAIKAVAEGDLAQAPSAPARADEIGDLGRALVVLHATAARARELEAEKLAATEARLAVAEDQTCAIVAFRAEIEARLGDSRAALSTLETRGRAMAAAAEAYAATGVTADHATNEADERMRAVAFSTQELAQSIGEIGQRVDRSAQVAAKAVREARETSSSVGELTEAARKIGEVVTLINAVAAQTNLLALNATIEAARAGEAGKGFAVVASEVKQLAGQTAKATEEIAAQVTRMQSATGSTASAIDAIGATIGEMDGIAAAIAAAVEEQQAFSSEIARLVGEASARTAEARTAIAAMAGAGDETGQASRDLEAARAELSANSGAIDAAMDAFVKKLQAA